jgi:cysteinyl-tRNA synthetase, unknown class
MSTPRNNRRASRLASWLAILLGLAGLVWLLSVIPLPRPQMPARSGPTLASVKAWGYQLQRFDAQTIPAEIDLMVVDYSRDGTSRRELSPSAVEELRRRPGASPRIVLAYMSAGEAETYRFYWRSHWNIMRPAWIGRENENWKGNFPVRFWDARWQRVLLEPGASLLSRLIDIEALPQKSYVDRIIEAGFDGIYLDRVDAFYDWTGERAGAEHDMVALVAEISRYARARRPGFLIVAQNGEELLEHALYRRAIDAIAKEDLMFGIKGAGVRNSTSDFLKSMQLLRKAREAGLPVFVVEYIEAEEQRREAMTRMNEAQFPVLFATKDLNRPPQLPMAGPASAPGKSP